MSEEKAKDIELKDLTKKALQDQIALSQKNIQSYQEQIVQFQNSVQQEIGIAGMAQHLLSKYKFPEEKPEEPKKTELEVK